ncbi:hypothetical protein KY360_05320 [Candidatus Woesearchaeota archaeon]|nr:hypothetical protein [Candidatus Woesearchaeota archaeon]
MRKIILLMLGMLIISQIAYAGVTNPLPTELNLFKGESGRFKFQIQTVASNREVECNYRLAKESPLVVEFDPAGITVPAGTVREVRGTVSVPEEVDFGTYEEKFCISCRPTAGQTGTSVAIDTCDLPIKVNVVSERARDNMFVAPKPSVFPWQAAVMVLLVLAVIIALVVVYVFGKRRLLRKLEKKR